MGLFKDKDYDSLYCMHISYPKKHKPFCSLRLKERHDHRLLYFVLINKFKIAILRKPEKGT